MNDQPISKPSYTVGGLDVHSMFHTIQGEGPFTGVPAIFIRLAGCNLRCPQCDTQYSTGGTLSAEQLVATVESVVNVPKLVVITGGEPLRQNIGRLVDQLHARGFIVQIETNGTLYPRTFDYSKVYVVCSPKLKMVPGFSAVVCAMKYVLHADFINPEDGLPTSVLGNIYPPARPGPEFTGTIYVQPIDVGDPAENKRHLEATVAVCMRFGYTLCLQTHKIINME